MSSFDVLTMAPPPIIIDSQVPFYSGLRISGSETSAVRVEGDMNVSGTVNIDETLNVSELIVGSGSVTGTLDIENLSSSMTYLETCSVSNLAVDYGEMTTLNVSNTLSASSASFSESTIVKGIISNACLTNTTSTNIDTTDITSTGVGHFTDLSVTSTNTALNSCMTNATIGGTLVLNGLSSDVPATTFQVYIANGTVNGVSGSLLAIVGE